MAELAVGVKLTGAEEAVKTLERLDAVATDAAKAAAQLGQAANQASISGLAKDAATAAKSVSGVAAAANSAKGPLSGMGAAGAAAMRQLSTAAAGAQVGFEKMSGASVAAVGAVAGAVSSLKATLMASPIAPLIAMASAAQALVSVFGNIVEFDKLSGQLKTVTGSAAGAAIAMDGLRQLATTLPVELSELAGAFVKLQSRGFDTTSESITRLSDLSSALGKGFDQVAEAVTDLAVGQTARMEELGISVTQNNGKVQISFGKTALEVNRNAGEIQSAIDRISLENFAGASAEQMERLGGKISNLGDAWASLSVAIGRAGVYEAIAWVVSKSADAITWLSMKIEQTSNTFAALSKAVRDPLNAVSILAQADAKYWQIAEKYSGGAAGALDAYNKQATAATAAMRDRQAEIQKAQAEQTKADEARKQAAKDAEAAAKAAASAAKAQAEAIQRQAIQQTQAVETYTEKLDRQLASYQELAAAAGPAFGGEALIRSQTAALAEYAEAIDRAYAGEVRQAKAAVDGAKSLYEQTAAAEKYVALQREIADSKATDAFERAAQGMITQAAATRAGTAAWGEYARAVDGVNFGDIVADWSRLNAEAEYTPQILQVSAEQMLRFGLAANSTQMAVGGVLDTMGKVELKAREQDQSAKAVEDAWKNAGRSIQGSLSDAFYTALDGGIDSFKDFSKAVVDIMKRTAAEIAAALVFKATFGGVTGAVGGLLPSAAKGATSAASDAGVTAAISAAASQVMGSISAGAASILPALSSVTTAIGPAAAGIIGAIGPVGIAVAAVGAAFALFGGDIKGLLGGILGGLGDIVSGIAGAVGDLLGGIADAVTDIVSGIASAIVGAAGDVAGGVFDSVTGVVGSVVDGVGDLLGGIFHGGGVVGQTAVQTRAMPASTWANAPRLHTGTPSLRHDEVPAILQRGEAVIPLKGGAVPVVGLGGGSSTKVNIYGAPAGSVSRRRTGSVDVFVRNLQRELSPAEALSA